MSVRTCCVSDLFHFFFFCPILGCSAYDHGRRPFQMPRKEYCADIETVPRCEVYNNSIRYSRFCPRVCIFVGTTRSCMRSKKLTSERDSRKYAGITKLCSHGKSHRCVHSILSFNQQQQRNLQLKKRYNTVVKSVLISVSSSGILCLYSCATYNISSWRGAGNIYTRSSLFPYS